MFVFLFESLLLVFEGWDVFADSVPDKAHDTRWDTEAQGDL
jgi:hypothetical protein